MNEQEKEIVDKLKKREYCTSYPHPFTWNEVNDLLNIINHLNKQLAEVKKTGEPFRKTCEYCMLLDTEVVGCIINEQFKALEQERGESLYRKHFRRLAQKLKEINHE